MLDNIIRIVGLGFFAFAVYLITKEVNAIGPAHILTVIGQTPWWVIVLAMLATLADYLFLGSYDGLALKYLHKKLPASTVIKTAAISFSISNTTGQSYASGGAVRYLFYTKAGLTRPEIFTLIGFETLTIFMGLGFAFVLSMILTPFVHTISAYPHLNTLYTAAALIIGAFMAYYFIIIEPRRHITLGQVSLHAPTLKITLLQGLVGLGDVLLESAVLFILLKFHMDVHFIPVFIVYVVAVTIGISSQVPGGIGVFEGLFLYLFPHDPPQKGMIMASLVLFRILYYFLPFFLAGLYLMITHFISRTHRPPKNNQQ